MRKDRDLHLCCPVEVETSISSSLMSFVFQPRPRSTHTMGATRSIAALPIPQILLLLLCLPFALAQFGGFFQQGFPFGGHHHQQQQQDQGGRAHKGWQEMDTGMSPHDMYCMEEKQADVKVTCRAGYVCPGSLACVPTPADCPCPYPYVHFLLFCFLFLQLQHGEVLIRSEDIKCVIPDKRPRDEGEGPPFICVRSSCEEVLDFSKPI
jgi:hypothetical protein